MNLTLLFDMDGTIADFYNVDGWLDALNKSDATPYRIAKPMWKMEELAEQLINLKNNGVEIKIVSWTSKNGTKDFNKVVRKAKVEWLKKYNFVTTHTHIVSYGTNKSKYRNANGTTILFDDNAEVRAECEAKGCICVDPTTTDIVAYLASLMD